MSSSLLNEIPQKKLQIMKEKMCIHTIEFLYMILLLHDLGTFRVTRLLMANMTDTFSSLFVEKYSQAMLNKQLSLGFTLFKVLVSALWTVYQDSILYTICK